MERANADCPHRTLSRVGLPHAVTEAVKRTRNMARKFRGRRTRQAGDHLIAPQARQLTSEPPFTNCRPRRSVRHFVRPSV